MVEIWTGTKKLDYDGDIELQYSVSDIRELGAGNLNTSFDIDIPHTDNNVITLKAINNLSSIEEQNDKTSILLNDIEAISGELKLIEYNNNYTKAIVSADDWLEVYSNTKLSETDLSSYNEVFNSTNVVASWTAAAGAFFRYPIVYWGKYDLFSSGAFRRELEATDFQAWFNVYKILEKIFTGYTIVSSFLTDTYFKTVYITANYKPVDSDYTNDKAMEVASETLDNTVTLSFTPGETKNISFTGSPVLFDTVVDNEFSYYDITYDRFTVPEDGTYRFTWNVEVILTQDLATLNSRTYRFKIVKYTGASATILYEVLTTTGIGSYINLLDSSYVHLLAGDTVQCEMTLTANLTGAVAGSSVTLRLKEGSTFKTIVNNRLLLPGLGYTIEPSEFMPDWSQADFINAVKKQYNLLIWLDRNNKNIYIEPYLNTDTAKTFYTENVKDISSQVDYDNINVELISDYYNKNVYLSFSEDDSDYLLSEYNKANELKKGTKKIVLDSVFTRPGDQELSVMFSTFITGTSNIFPLYNKLVPIIWGDWDRAALYLEPQERLTGFNTKIGEWKGLVAGVWDYEDVAQTTYPLIEQVDFSTLYPLYFSKYFHLVDKGKLIKLNGISNLLDIQQFTMVINTATTEGFRLKYKFLYQNEYHYGYINNVKTDGKRFIYEIILIK